MPVAPSVTRPETIRVRRSMGAYLSFDVWNQLRPGPVIDGASLTRD
jgi:hypothetical protein